MKLSEKLQEKIHSLDGHRNARHIRRGLSEAITIIEQHQAEQLERESIDISEQLAEALIAIDTQAMQVMQDDTGSSPAYLACGWVHETCKQALAQYRDRKGKGEGEVFS